MHDFVREFRSGTGSRQDQGKVDSGYIHGFSPQEQRRLVAQARVLAPNVFAGLALPDEGRLLEVGCGVGAELKLMAQQRPRLQLVGLDLSPTHLLAAKQHLAPEIRAGRAGILRGDALRLPLENGSFDRVVSIWMLEHVSDPAPVMAEALRVLRPDGMLICTEVDNGTFAFEPEQPAIREWWSRFNRCQVLNGGDPFVGRRLEQVARGLGCGAIRTEVLPIISSRREPARRRVLLGYLRELLLSGREDLYRRGLADDGLIARLKDEFARVQRDSDVHFRYHAVRLSCRPGSLDRAQPSDSWWGKSLRGSRLAIDKGPSAPNAISLVKYVKNS